MAFTMSKFNLVQTKTIRAVLIHPNCRTCIKIYFSRSTHGQTSTAFKNVYNFNVDNNIDKRQSLESIPGPTGIYSLPFIGFISNFKPFGQFTSGSFHKFLKHLNYEYGDIVKHRVGTKWMVFLFNPDDIRNSLWQDEKYPYRNESLIMKAYVKRKNENLGLAFQNGKQWEMSRRLLQEHMCPKAVSGYRSGMLQIADNTLQMSRSNCVISDTHQFLSRYGMECASMLCFGPSLQNMTDDAMLHDVDNFLETFSKSYDTLPLFLLFKTPLYKKFEESYGAIKSAAWKSLNQTASRQMFNERMPTSLISLLLQGNELTHDEICSIIADLYITAVDSTSNVLSFVLYHLAKYQTCQEKLYEEIHNAPVTPDGEMSFKNMPYLKACVKESMRLVPPLRDGIRRTLDKDIVVSGYHIPKGNVLVYCNNTICTNDSYFHDADKFLPERWLRSVKDKEYIHPYASLPFGQGKRNCLGQRFAELMMYAFIAQLSKNYRFYLKPDQRTLGYEYKLFSTPDRRFALQLEPRVK